MASAASAVDGRSVLDVDPDLGTDIDPAEWELVRQACRGELLYVPSGPWRPGADADGRGDLVAYVVVEGLVAREISFPGSWMVEFLGNCDVLLPPVATDPPRLGTAPRLTAVSDLILLVLGQPFLRSAARWPTLLTTLHRRLESQRESLAIQGLIAHLPNAEHRLLLMLWHLSDRWGYVTPDGIVLPLPFNHKILGQLIGARRPTVTIALRGLEAAAAVRRREDGSWLLTPTAERMITAIARPPSVVHSVGERLMLYRRISQTAAQNRALQAEVRQTLLRRRAGSTTDGRTPHALRPPPAV